MQRLGDDIADFIKPLALLKENIERTAKPVETSDVKTYLQDQKNQENLNSIGIHTKFANFLLETIAQMGMDVKGNFSDVSILKIQPKLQYQILAKSLIKCTSKTTPGSVFSTNQNNFLMWLFPCIGLGGRRILTNWKSGP